MTDEKLREAAYAAGLRLMVKDMDVAGLGASTVRKITDAAVRAVTEALSASGGSKILGKDVDDAALQPSGLDTLFHGQQWQPIETAPDEGDVIVIGGRHSTPATVPADGSWWRYHRSNGGLSTPTLWMPLPAPPTTKQCDPLEVRNTDYATSTTRSVAPVLPPEVKRVIEAAREKKASEQK